MIEQQLKLAWAAGFVDGEAYIGVYRLSFYKSGRTYYQLALDIAQVKRAPLDAMVDLFGGKVRQAKNWHGPIFVWRLTGIDAGVAIQALAPYLVGKRDNAILAMAFVDTLDARRGSKHGQIPDEVANRRQAIWAAFRVLNARRPFQAERLSESAPALPDDAIVRSHGKKNHETEAETASALRAV